MIAVVGMKEDILYFEPMLLILRRKGELIGVLKRDREMEKGVSFDAETVKAHHGCWFIDVAVVGVDERGGRA